jgi:hypothetical protein
MGVSAEVCRKWFHEKSEEDLDGCRTALENGRRVGIVMMCNCVVVNEAVLNQNMDVILLEANEI